jgi:hypothetical protein
MKKFTMLAGASLLMIAGSAFAEQSLTDTQMDKVSAGALVFLQANGVGTASGAALSNLLGNTTSNTHSLADPLGVLSGTPGFGVAIGHGDNTSISTSVTNGSTIGGAQAASTSFASASIF